MCIWVNLVNTTLPSLTTPWDASPLNLQNTPRGSFSSRQLTSGYTAAFPKNSQKSTGHRQAMADLDVHCADADHGIRVLWLQRTNSHGILSPVAEKGRQGHSLKRRAPGPLPWQAFIAFLDTLHWGWSSFTMHRSALGGNLLQKTKERMLLMSSKRTDICKCKGKSGWTGYTRPWKV